MAVWYIVKLNWKLVPAGYLGVEGDSWPDLHHVSTKHHHGVHDDFFVDSSILSKNKSILKELECRREYVETLAGRSYVVTDFMLAQKYFQFLTELKLKPVFIELTDDLNTSSCDGYDFGNATGGYSVIADLLIGRDDAKRYLNEHHLFKNIDCLRGFVKLARNMDGVEYLDGGLYEAVAVTCITV